MPTKLLIVDDHEMVRRGIAEMVDTADVQVVAEAADGDAGVSAARRHKPDVVLLDVRMNGQDGIDAIKRIRSAAPHARVVMLSAFDNSTYVARAVSAGAHDYVLKTATRKELLEAIGGAAKNAAPSRSGEFRRVASAMAKREVSTATDVPLTPRETQVLRQVALGLSNREIADALEISSAEVAHEPLGGDQVLDGARAASPADRPLHLAGARLGGTPLPRPEAHPLEHHAHLRRRHLDTLLLELRDDHDRPRLLTLLLHRGGDAADLGGLVHIFRGLLLDHGKLRSSASGDCYLSVTNTRITLYSHPGRNPLARFFPSPPALHAHV